MSDSPAQPVLALPGPVYCFRYDGDFTINGLPIVVHQEGGQGRGTAWAVWDGAAAAAKYLEAAAAEVRSAGLASVLELGSGTGLAGLAAAAALQLPAVLTDLPDALPALQRNIEANPHLAPLVSAAPLDWCRPHEHLAALPGSVDVSSTDSTSIMQQQQQQQVEHPALHWQSQQQQQQRRQQQRPPRLVLAADCVWLEELVAPFVSALELTASSPGDRALMAYQSRSSRVDGLLFGLLALRFDVRPAPQLPGEPPRGPIDVYWLVPRAEV